MFNFLSDSLPTKTKALTFSVPLSIFIDMLICIFGVTAADLHPQYIKPAQIAFYIIFGVMVFLLAIQRARLVIEAKKIKKADVLELNNKFDSEKKETAEMHKSGDLRKMNSKLKLVVLRARLYVTCFFIMGLALAFFGPCSKSRVPMIIGIVLPFVILTIYLYRFAYVRFDKFDWSGYSKEEEYPTLFNLARKAEKQCGIKGKIHIAFVSENNVGIAKAVRKRHGDLSLQIGVPVLDALSEEELYNIFLHEFSHLLMTEYKDPTMNNFCFALLGDFEETGLVKGVVNWVISYYCLMLLLNKEKYTILNSEFCEAATDKKAVELGNPKAFAAGLVKINMIDRSELVYDDYFEPDHLFFLQEDGQEDACTYSLDIFRKAYNDHNKRWLESFKKERQPRNATHPIVRERVKNIGVELEDVEYSLPNRMENTPFRQECRKVFYHMNQKLREENWKSRGAWKTEYEKNEKILQEYYENKKEGKYTPEKFRSIVQAFFGTCKNAELLEFFHDVLDNPDLDQYEKALPMGSYGAYLLKHDDIAGLPLVYKAIELNSNFIDAGLDEIGSFCCRNGLEDEYQKYRTKAAEYYQYQKDVVDERIEIRASDKLSAETFEWEKLDSIREYILNVGEGHIKAIYLVHKTISDDIKGYASQFILEFDSGCNDALKSKVYDKVFNYLDTRPEDWEYALLIYTPEIGRIVSKVKNSCIYKKEE